MNAHQVHRLVNELDGFWYESIVSRQGQNTVNESKSKRLKSLKRKNFKKR